MKMLNNSNMASVKDINTYSGRGRFLYADYSPLEDDRNVIEMLKGYVSLTARLIELRTGNEKLSSILKDSESLRRGIAASLGQIRTGTASTIQSFGEKHSEVMAAELRGEGLAMLENVKGKLSELLGDAESDFNAELHRYKETISAKITGNNAGAIALVQEWLSRDHANFPRPLLASLASNVVVALGQGEGYDISRFATVAMTKAEHSVEKQPPEQNDAMQFSYVIKIDASELEFWNYKRKASELGVKDLMLPVGMKAPMSEKLKQTFRFGSKDSEISKEPEFKRVDDYYIVRAELAVGKTLTLQLASDAMAGPDSLFRITYDVDSLTDVQKTPSNPSRRQPRIDHVAATDGQPLETTDLLQIGEIERMSDTSKIMLLGAAALARMNILTDPATVASRGKLESLKLHDCEIITAGKIQEEVDFERLFEFLGHVASPFGVIVDRLKKKTPVQDELILRQDADGGQRREFTVRLDELRSLLADARFGRPISETLGLQ